MPNPKSFYTILIALVLGAYARQLEAQSVLEAEIISTVSRDELTAMFGFQALNGVIAYSVTYTTLGTDMLPDTASGLIVLPDEPSEKGVIAYQHGTTDGPDDVPSKLNSEGSLGLAFAGQGYIISAADYHGLGESRGFHPYVHAETEARAGIDLLIAARQLATEEGFENIPLIFLAGYSQGGHASMAMAQAMQERPTDDLFITAAAPMSGPYSISEAMYDLVFKSNQNYNYPSYLAYIVMGYQEAYGNIYNDLGEVFNAPFVPMLEQFYNGEIGLSELNAKMINQMLVEYQSLVPKKMLVEEYVSAVENDSLHPTNIALRDNDTYLWTPDFPMRLFYCSGDDQVPFENSIIAAEYMDSVGAEDVEALDLGAALDHGGCVFPALLSTLAFFDSFQESTSAKSYPTAQKVVVYPNPANQRLTLKNIESTYHGDISIFNAQGQLMFSKPYNSDGIDVSSLPIGIYSLSYHKDGIPFYSPFVIHR